MDQPQYPPEYVNAKICIAVALDPYIAPDVEHYASMMYLAKPNTHGFLYCAYGFAQVDAKRNYLAREFLKTDFDYLFYVDTDLLFNRSDLFKVWETAQKQPKAGIVGGLYFFRTPAFCPVAVDPATHLTFAELKDGDVIEAEAVGGGFMLIRRQVFIDMVKHRETINLEEDYIPATANTPRDHIFKFFKYERRTNPEDWFGCRNARRLGWRVYLDCRVNTAHVGRLYVNKDFIRRATGYLGRQ